MTQAVPTGAGGVEQHSHVLGAGFWCLLWAAAVSSSRSLVWMFCGCMACVIRVKCGVLFLTMLSNVSRLACSSSSLALGSCKYVGYMSQLLPLHRVQL